MIPSYPIWIFADTFFTRRSICSVVCDNNVWDQLVTVTSYWLGSHHDTCVQSEAGDDQWGPITSSLQPSAGVTRGVWAPMVNVGHCYECRHLVLCVMFLLIRNEKCVSVIGVGSILYHWATEPLIKDMSVVDCQVLTWIRLTIVLLWTAIRIITLWKRFILATM